MKLILKQAIQAHQDGKLEEAKQLYRKVLKAEPKNADANHNLGILVNSKNETTEALLLFKTATEINPNIEQYWISYIQLLINSNEYQEAQLVCKNVIKNKSDSAQIYFQLSVALIKLKRFDEAEIYCKKAIKFKTDYAEAHNNLGFVSQKLNKLDEAQRSYKKAIEIKPDIIQSHSQLGDLFYSIRKFEEAKVCYEKVIKFKSNHYEVYNKLGNIAHAQNRLFDAEIYYKKAIELRPDNAKALNNLGVILKKLNKNDDAEKTYRNAIKINPNYAATFNNLANIQYDKGDMLSSIKNFKKALNIDPDFHEPWVGIFFSLQAIKLQNSSIENYLPNTDKLLGSKYAKVMRSLLIYHLNLGSSSTNKYFNKALSTLSLVEDIFIKNTKISSTESIKKPIVPKKITALIHFGRSGTGLLHSLIDGHPEISTLPSIYFSEFFDYFTWKRIIAGGWKEMAERFTEIFAVLFDASSTIKIPTKNPNYINIGEQEGMTNVGATKNEVLFINKKVFVKKLNQLMDHHNSLNAFSFFQLVHLAYEKTLLNNNIKNHIFYHIHNPDLYAKLNFLKMSPDTRWLMMVREPLQSCESWIIKDFYDNNYTNISNKIIEMLFELDQVIFKNKNSVGVRLEDLKIYPNKTILSLCDWLGIKESDTLYQMTAQGKKWWGDPTSPDFIKDGMNPFGKTSINRKIGLVFSENDQFILRTLFHPFSVRFGYAKENLKQFKKDLLEIRPMIDQMFDFEKKIIYEQKIDIDKFNKSGPYLYLRNGMIERWNTLNKFNTYPNMITKLKIN